MFLKLHEIEDPEKKAFILETLHLEFKDVANEARKVFKKFIKLGSPVAIMGTPNEDFRVPIPYKLAGIHDVWENNSSWICPKNLFDESSVLRHDYKGYSKPHLDRIHFFVPTVDLNDSLDVT
jgi:hypothetical protein